VFGGVSLLTSLQRNQSVFAGDTKAQITLPTKPSMQFLGQGKRLEELPNQRGMIEAITARETVI